MQHDRAQRRLCALRRPSKGKEVRINAALPDTTRGRDLAVMVRKTALSGGCLSNFGLVDEGHGAVALREIRSAELVIGAAVVDSSSYPTTQVAVRHKATGRRRVWL